MSKHTAGPWIFRQYALTDEMVAEAKSLGMEPIRFINNDGSVPVTSADTNICSVDCQAKFRRGIGHKAECDERDANARLIAASPDMYAALYEALEFAERYSDVIDGDDGVPEANNAMRLVSELKRVIAKAEGR